MIEQNTTSNVSPTKRVYYNYGDEQIDLKHYIHNLNSNINRFLATKFDWDNILKDAFRNKVSELCSGLLQLLSTNSQRFSTDTNGTLHDADSTFNYLQDIITGISLDGSTGSSIDLNTELNEYANLIGSTIAIKGYNKDYYDALDKQKEEQARKAKALKAKKASLNKDNESTSSNPDGTDPSKYNLDLQGFLAYLKALDNLYSKENNSFKWDDIYKLDNSEDTTERNKFLAEELQAYTKALSESTLNFEDTQYGSQLGYLDALKNAYNALNDGYNYELDKEALNNIGIDDDFLNNWFKSSSIAAGTVTEGRSINDNFLEKLLSINVDITNSYNENSSLQINAPRFKEIGDTNTHTVSSKDANGNVTSRSSSDAAKMINALNQLASYIGVKVPQIKDKNATAKWIDDREAELIQLLKTKNTAKAKTLAEGLVAFNDLFKKVYGSGIFISDDTSGLMYLDYRNVNPGVAVVYDTVKKRIYLKKLIDLQGTAIYNNIAGAMSGTMSARKGGKFETGGTIADILYQSREDMKSDPSESDENFEHRKATVIRIGSSQNTLNPEEDDLKYEDYARLASLATNVASVFMDPISGGIASAAASTADLTADIADDSVSWWDAAKNYATNLGLDVVGLIPSMEFLKIGRQIKTSAKLLGKAMAIYGVGMGLKNSENYINAINEIGNGNITRENVKQAGQAIMLLATAIKTGKGIHLKNKAAKLAKEQKRIGLTVVDKDGKKYDLDIQGEFADKVRNTHNRKELQELFDKEIKNQDSRLSKGEFTIDTRQSTIPIKVSFKNSNGETFKGEKGNKSFFPVRKNLKSNTWNPLTREEMKLSGGSWYRKAGDPNVEGREVIKINNNATLPTSAQNKTTTAHPILNYFEGTTGTIIGKQNNKFVSVDNDKKSLIEERGVATLNVALERIKRKSDIKNIFKSNPNDPSLPTGYDGTKPTGLEFFENLLNSMTGKRLGIKIKLPGDPNTYYWKPKATTKLNELKTNLNLILKSGGKIQLFKTGGALKKAGVAGVDVVSGSSWEGTVGKPTWENIITKLSENPNYYKTINSMLDKHYDIYKEATDSNWVPSGNAHIGYNNSVGNYQTEYLSLGYNTIAIEPNYPNRYFFNGGKKNRNKIDTPTEWRSDNAYASITDDRRLLGRNEDYTEDLIKFKNDLLKKFNLELYKDSSTGYYKIKPIGITNPDFGDAPSTALDDGTSNPSLPINPDVQEIKNPLLKKGFDLKGKLTDVAPMLMEYLNMRYLNSRNAENGEMSKKAIFPNLRPPFNHHRLVYGDLAARNEAEQEAALLYNEVARLPLTSDAGAQLAALMDAAFKGSLLRIKGDAVDNKLYRTTQELLNELEHKNAYNSYLVAEANNKEAITAIRLRVAVDNATHAKHTANTENFIKLLIADTENRIKEKKQLKLASDLKDIETLAVTNPAALGINFTNGELNVLRLVTSGEVLPSDIPDQYKGLYRSANAKVNFAKAQLLRRNYGIEDSDYATQIIQGLYLYNPYISDTPKEEQNNSGIPDLITAQITPTTQRLESNQETIFFKKGGKTDDSKITVAKIKEKIKNADRLLKVIIKSNESVNKLIARIIDSLDSIKPTTIKLKY